MAANKYLCRGSSGILGRYLMSTWTNPGSSSLKGFGLAVATEGSSCSRNTLRLETLCRRKQRLTPERETVVLRNSCVTANRSSKGSSRLVRKATVICSCAGERLAVKGMRAGGCLGSTLTLAPLGYRVAVEMIKVCQLCVGNRGWLGLTFSADSR